MASVALFLGFWLRLGSASLLLAMPVLDSCPTGGLKWPRFLDSPFPEMYGPSEKARGTTE